jgi:diguanylate cyclase (GGDEF)-like protein
VAFRAGTPAAFSGIESKPGALKMPAALADFVDAELPVLVPRLARGLDRRLANLQAENAALRAEVAELTRFRDMAYRDPLTNLWNRRYLDDRLAEELSRAARDRHRGFSVLVIDVDGLKRVNDTEGHAAGDRVIVAVADLLRRSLRAHDVICRTGGDEFAVLFTGVAPDTCAVLVERLRRQLSEPLVRAEIPFGLSMGAASYGQDGATAEALLTVADQAMYFDKRDRRACRG